MSGALMHATQAVLIVGLLLTLKSISKYDLALTKRTL